MLTLGENRFFAFFSWKKKVREFLLYVAVDPHASEYIGIKFDVLSG